MKNRPIKILILSFLFFIACEKKDNTNPNPTNTEISLEQKPIILADSLGNKISITYFAKGDEVAVKLKKDNVTSVLSAKGTNIKGEPIFSDGSYAWELMDDGHSGRLRDKEGKVNIYK